MPFWNDRWVRDLCTYNTQSLYIREKFTRGEHSQKSAGIGYSSDEWQKRCEMAEDGDTDSRSAAAWQSPNDDFYLTPPLPSRCLAIFVSRLSSRMRVSTGYPLGQTSNPRTHRFFRWGSYVNPV